MEDRSPPTTERRGLSAQYLMPRSLSRAAARDLEARIFDRDRVAQTYWPLDPPTQGS